MSTLTVSLGLDAAGFISGVRTAGEQAERGMAMVAKAYTRAARSQNGLTDAAIAQQAQNMRNLGVADQEIAKYTETANSLRMYKQELKQLGDAYKGNTAGMNAHLAAFGRQNGLASLAVINARELAAQQAAVAAKTERHARASQQLSGSLGGAIGQMRGMVGMLAGFVGLRELVSMSDEWTTLNNRIRLVTESEKQLLAVRSGLIESANKTGQSIGGVAQLYQRLAASKTELRMSDEDLLEITDTINKTMVLSGGAAASQEAAIIQLSQAMASGQLRGQELNSVLEQAPGLAQAIAKGMGITVGQLRQFSQDGQLTAQNVISALKKVRGSVNDDFGQVNLTISQSTQILRNKLTEFIGTSNDATGAANLLSGGIRLIADNIGLVSVAVGGLMALALAKWVMSTTVQVVALTAAMVMQGRAALGAAAGNTTYAASLKTISGAGAAGNVAALGQAFGSLKTALAGMGGLAAVGTLFAAVGVAAYPWLEVLKSADSINKGGSGANAINDSFEAWLRLFGLLKENESLGGKMYDLLHTESGEFNYKVLLEISPVGVSLSALRKLLGDESNEKQKVSVAAEVDAAYEKQQADARGDNISAAGKQLAEDIGKMSSGFIAVYTESQKTAEQLKLLEMETALEKLRKEEGSGAAVKAAEADIAKALAAYETAAADKRTLAVWQQHYEQQLASSKAVQDYIGGLQGQMNALGKTKDQLIAMEMSALGASNEQIRLAQSVQGVISKYEKQQAVMATLADLDKQVAQMGMSDIERQLDELRRKGADDGQLAHAARQLRTLDEHRKAAEAQQRAASEQARGAAQTLGAGNSLQTGAEMIRDSAIALGGAAQKMGEIDYSKMSDAELYSGKIDVRFGAAAEERRRREMDRGGMYGNARGVVDLSPEALASLRRLNPGASVDAVANSILPVSIKRPAEQARSLTETMGAGQTLDAAADTMMAGAVKFDEASQRFIAAATAPGFAATAPVNQPAADVKPTQAFELTLKTEGGQQVRGTLLTTDNFPDYVKKLARDMG